MMVEARGSLALPIILFLLASPSLAAVNLTSIEVEPHKHYDNFTIKIDKEITPTAYLAADPYRLVLDFKGAAVKKPFSFPIRKNKRVESVSASQLSKKPLVARVVFQLNQPIKYEIAALYGRGEVWCEIAEGRESLPAKILPMEIPKPTALPPQKTKGRPLKNFVIVVDPGHGGDDPGAFGKDGLLEKNINLKTGIYLAKYLRNKGATVFLTRSTDTRKELPEIVEFVNRLGADAYIGVHFNYIDNPSISGTETYYYNSFSRELAENVHRSLLYGLRRKDRGIRRARLYTIHHTRVPAVIVEPIYLTGQHEGYLVKSSSFLKEVAQDISQGVEEYFRSKRR